MAIDVYGILYMTKKWSVPENVDNKVNNMSQKRDLDKDWIIDWLTDAIHQNVRNLDESEYERALRTGVCPNCVGQLFWNP